MAVAVVVLIRVYRWPIVLSLTAPSVSNPQSTSSTPGVVGNLASDTLASNWATYTDQENFFSIQYPDLGTLIVTHPYPRGDYFAWENDGEFDFGVALIDRNGLTFNRWLAENTDQSLDDTMTTIDGMNGVLEFIRQQGILGTVHAYLEPDSASVSFIYDIQFQCYTYGNCMPPYWTQILNSFRMLPPR